MRFTTLAHTCAFALFGIALSWGQETRADAALKRGLYYADLYNWEAARPSFEEAERLFTAAGNRRGELYAKLGRLRSNIDHNQQTLPAVAMELAEALDSDPRLLNDKTLRMFCLIVKGDIDTETNTASMRQDWLAGRTLATDLGDAKWQYRALGQLGIAAFYEADVETARKEVAEALELATKAKDSAAVIKFLTVLANGMLQSRQLEQSLQYAESAVQLANATRDVGYPFSAREIQVDVLLGLHRIVAARDVTDDLLQRARASSETSHEASGLMLAAEISVAEKSDGEALASLNQAIALSKSAGLPRLLEVAYAQKGTIYRDRGELAKAEQCAELAAEAAQESGDLWGVPARLATLARLQTARGRYPEADRTYERAEAFVEAMIGKVSSVLDKTAITTAASEIYAEHFTLVADRLNDPRKAFAIIEQVRGRAAADILAAGAVPNAKAERTEARIAQLRLDLMTARSTSEVKSLRNQIVVAEEARWVTPDLYTSKPNVLDPVNVEHVQQTLPQSSTILEYVLANPHSYCLAITHNDLKLVRLDSKSRIDALVRTYLHAIQQGLSAGDEERALYDQLIGPVANLRKRTLIIVRDGLLYRVPFDALRDSSGRYVVQRRTVYYEPSATAYYLLEDGAAWDDTTGRGLLAVGGVPYGQSNINLRRLFGAGHAITLEDLPASRDEVEIARTAVGPKKSTVLLGSAATEAAFKSVDLARFRVIHLAVHAVADPALPDRAALIFLSDSKSGEDGLLQPPEIVRLRLNAELVVLSACDTAVGPLQGQEGVENLSSAFLLAGARSVVSTLWQIEDSASLFLMKRFYAHLVEGYSTAGALATAKREMLRMFGAHALPRDWAGYIVEGDGSERIEVSQRKDRN